MKIGVPLIGETLAPLLRDVAGGLLKKAIPGQNGKSFVNDALRTAAKYGIHVTIRAFGHGGNGLASNESRGRKLFEENGSERSLEDGSSTSPSGLEERSSRISLIGIETGPHECDSIGN